ncbi:hypothetical protein MALU111345_10180 [Marinicrinis lubricantis]
MIVILFRLLVVIAFILLAIGIYNVMKGYKHIVKTAKQGVERCPACDQIISVPQSVTNCPKCNVKLGRGANGSLLIRIND